MVQGRHSGGLIISRDVHHFSSSVTVDELLVNILYCLIKGTNRVDFVNK